MDIARLISDRAHSIDASGIRRVFELGATLKNPCNLSIGQPEFPVPEAVRRATIEAIDAGRNGYTVTQGVAPLLDRLRAHLAQDVGWPERHDDMGVLVTSGTSGALVLAAMALLGPGDECVIPDPYFVMYPALAKLCAARAVPCDTYPDFRLTASRVEPLLTERTKFVLACSPGNPTGVTLTQRECDDLRDLCRARNVLLISDEIYDRFVFPAPGTPWDAPGFVRCPSPTRQSADSYQDTLLVRGFGKTYACTGWRLGYAAGPRRLIEEMAKLQQYTFVCAPAPAQWGAIAALDVDMREPVEAYARRRDRVLERLGPLTEIAAPTGAFYAFPRVPERLGMTGTEFATRAVEHSLLVIPGGVFSTRDTHFRMSYATDDATLDRGLDILEKMFKA
ncbi:MAG: aminotransferase class I/II-fold pyridoxal phosphate-dependent enzyme [Phycisphaerales bacterium]|nr:MAG: aminotransferase class I/II-fold pyridoxal phosphate-dependent enzyme [Phycisphaerales bacterium]